MKKTLPKYISSELIFIKDILAGNEYPEKIISQKVENRKKKLNELTRMEEDDLNQETKYFSLLYSQILYQNGVIILIQIILNNGELFFNQKVCGNKL